MSNMSQRRKLFYCPSHSLSPFFLSFFISKRQTHKQDKSEEDKERTFTDTERERKGEGIAGNNIVRRFSLLPSFRFPPPLLRGIFPLLELVEKVPPLSFENIFRFCKAGLQGMGFGRDAITNLLCIVGLPPGY
jgi:hypothetical protein